MFSADQGARKFQTPIAAMKTKKERSSTVKRPYGLLDFLPKGLQDPWSAAGQNEEKSHAKPQRRKG
jgi:hypothetical protein